MTISKRKREKIIKLISDFEKQNKPKHYITIEFFIHRGFIEEDIAQILSVLEGMGYIEYKSLPRVAKKYISLTNKGRCYFETKKDDRIEFIKRNILVPIIVSVITTLVTLLITNYINGTKISNDNTIESQIKKDKQPIERN